jgi:transcription elongation GreA/GreB family factor
MAKALIGKRLDDEEIVDTPSGQREIRDRRDSES